MRAARLHSANGGPLLVDDQAQATSDAAFSAAQEGILFRAAYEFNFAVAGAIRYSLENPAGSGKILIVRSASYYVSLLTGVIAVRLNLRLGATENLPVEVRPIYPVRLGAADTTVGILKARPNHDAPPTEPAGGFFVGNLALAEETELLYSDSPMIVLAPGALLTIGGNFESSARIIIELVYAERDA